MVLFSCSTNPILPEDPSVLEIDARLPQDSNGYYHLILNRYKQTVWQLSAFTGHLGQRYDMPKVVWEAYDENGDIKVVLVATGKAEWINGELVKIYEEVSIINGSSYPNMDGVVRTMLGPFASMVGDTVTVVCGYVSAYENKLYDEVYIIFD